MKNKKLTPVFGVKSCDPFMCSNLLLPGLSKLLKKIKTPRRKHQGKKCYEQVPSEILSKHITFKGKQKHELRLN